VLAQGAEGRVFETAEVSLGKVVFCLLLESVGEFQVGMFWDFSNRVCKFGENEFSL
jgi:hypothetical protein